MHARSFAHAKINLALRVLSREASGFHSIETLFQALELADIVDVELHDAERALQCDGPAMPADGLGSDTDNLATRAAIAYAEAARWPTGWHISIEKNIPVGGGLGGGSADAAGVLRALEALSPQPLGTTALIELAGTLGADVPFVLSEAPLAWAWARGDRLLPLPALPRMAVQLLTFEHGVNTGAAYQALAAARDNANIRAQSSLYPIEAFNSWSSVVGLASNDFETVVPAMHPGVARWLPAVRHAASRLSSQGMPAIGLLSGSGATCYLLCADAVVPDFTSVEGMRVLKTHTMTRTATF